MKVVHIASEISPIAKVGGLADVVYGLCHACSEKGHEVCVIIPAYADLKKSFFTINKENFIEISEDFQFRYFKKKFKFRNRFK